MLPKFVYEALPFAYFFIATLIFVSNDSHFRWIPAGLFLLCGALVLRWRIQGRKQTTRA